ncbi:MAG: cobalamin biosynthesis protein CbiX [Opitutaceae bacterium]|nr:cobalamin biosynthesis protein CbiX [Opitutaceae bacterium]
MIFLTDNGSIRAAAYKNLGNIAHDLSKVIGETVIPAPLLHADKIAPNELDGKSAKLLEVLLADAYDVGIRDFTILPLFFGPSAALVDYLPRRLSIFSKKRSGFTIRILNPLVSEKEDDTALLTDLLTERVEHVAEEFGLQHFNIILVDHGSPRREVNKIRNRIARCLSERFEVHDVEVRPASMERRSGTEYDFNEPLLESSLSQPPHSSGDTVIAQLFFSPGRHAGAGGDIATICKKAELENSNLRTYRTKLVGDHPKLIDLLKLRWEERNEIPMTHY